MACTLYREGKGTVEHGIECESTTVEVHYLQSMIEQGWLPSPPGYIPPEPVAEADDAEDEFLADEGSAPTEVEALLSAEVERLKGEISDLNQELDIQRKIEDNLNAQVSRLNKTVKELEEKAAAGAPGEDQPPQEAPPEDEEPGDGINPTRAAGRDAGIEGWETMHLSTLKKTLKDLEA
nr:hypothetical protein [uncultured Pseudomonas sp.]